MELDEARELKTLTKKVIDQSGYTMDDLDEMERKIRNIIAGLQIMNDDANDLDELGKQVANILGDLKMIADGETVHKLDAKR